MKPVKYLLVLYTLILSAAISCSIDNSIPVKNWEILYNQDDSLDKVKNETGWKPVSIPGKFNIPDADSDNFNYFWLRGNFHICGDPSRYYGLSVGKLILFDKVYINGHFIGSMHPKKINWSPLPRNYVLPEDVLKRGVNNIYIQLGYYGNHKGGILNDVLIQTEEFFDTTQYASNLISNQLPAGTLVIALCFIIPLFIIFFWNRKEKLILYGLFALFVYIIYILTLLVPYRFISFEFFVALQMSITPLVFISVIMIIQSIYRIYLSNYNRIIIPLLSLFVIIILFCYDTPYYYEVGFTLRLISVLISVPFLFFLIYRLNRMYPDRFLLRMMITMAIIAVIIILLETYLGYTGGRFTDIMGLFSPVIFIMLLAVIISREIMKRRMQLDMFYDKLKRYEGHEKELSITDTSEEKLKRVIEFINENYTSDLSREGLAAAVGINPNYMGSLFKTYTGKTINEYINHLRIEDASKQLLEKNRRITDIAFSIGFESLVTFNRVFKKIMGQTPTEYRDKKAKS